MKDRLSKLLEAPVFLDSDDLIDLRELLRIVARSDVFVLLQTSNVLARPWCLLETYTAILNHVPIVAINVEGSFAYSYQETAELLDSTKEEQSFADRLASINPGAVETIRKQQVPVQGVFHDVNIEELGQALERHLPNLVRTILCTFFCWSHNVCAGTDKTTRTSLTNYVSVLAARVDIVQVHPGRQRDDHRCAAGGHRWDDGAREGLASDGGRAWRAARPQVLRAREARPPDGGRERRGAGGSARRRGPEGGPDRPGPERLTAGAGEGAEPQRVSLRLIARVFQDGRNVNVAQ
jgi:hypothetical protein